MSLAGYMMGGGGFIEFVGTARERLSEPVPTGLLKIIHIAKDGFTR